MKKIEIKGDSGEIKISEEGISIKGDDSGSIKINSTDGIKIEGKDGKIEIKAGDSGKIKLENEVERRGYLRDPKAELAGE